MTRRAASPDYIEGFVHYFRGERQKGLEFVRQAVADGYYLRLDAPFLEPMLSDPDFEPIRELQESNVARERRRLLDAVCDDNPYESIWSPSDNTCNESR